MKTSPSFQTIISSIVAVGFVAVTAAGCGARAGYPYGEATISGPALSSTEPTPAGSCPNPIPLETSEMPEISFSHRWADGGYGFWKLVRTTVFTVHEHTGNSFAAELLIQRTPGVAEPQVYQHVLCNGVGSGNDMSSRARAVDSISRQDGSYSSDRDASFRVNEYGGYDMTSRLISHYGFAQESTGPITGFGPGSISSRIYRRSYREVEMRVRVESDRSYAEDQRMTMYMSYVYQLMD